MFCVIDLINPRTAMAGKLGRFLVEPRANLFVGKISRRALDELLVELREHDRPAIIIWSDGRCEQGFRALCIKPRTLTFVDLDGFLAISRGKSGS